MKEEKKNCLLNIKSNFSVNPIPNCVQIKFKVLTHTHANTYMYIRHESITEDCDSWILGGRFELLISVAMAAIKS